MPYQLGSAHAYKNCIRQDRTCKMKVQGIPNKLSADIWLVLIPQSAEYGISRRDLARARAIFYYSPIVLLLNSRIQVLHSAVWGQCMPVVDA